MTKIFIENSLLICLTEKKVFDMDSGELSGIIQDGKDYYISDPTYIGANVGECMPGYETESPEIFKL